MPPITFTAVLAFEGTPTGDSRYLPPNSLTWSTPIPFRTQPADIGAHDGAITVGSLDEVWREDDGNGGFLIMGSGRFDHTTDAGISAAIAAHLGFRTGISIDPRSAVISPRVMLGGTNAIHTIEEVVAMGFATPDDLPPGSSVLESYESARLRGATIVDIPAFEDARITSVDLGDIDISHLVASLTTSVAPAPTPAPTPSPSPSPSPITAAASPVHSTPAIEGDWDGDRIEKALPTGEPAAFYRRFYAYQAPDTDGTAKDHWHYLHHYYDTSTGESGAASVTAARAVIGLLNGARGVQTVAKGSDRQAVYDHLATHMRDAGVEPPDLHTTVTASSSLPTEESPMSEFELRPATTLDPDCDLATLTASSAPSPDSPSSFTIPTLPASSFTPFHLPTETPLTVTDSGQVFGHVALSSVCHVGMPKCVTMPRSASSLRYFHTGVVRLDDDTDVPTGRITMRGPHADISLSWRSAMAHYDDTTTAIADVVAVEDDFGIAVFGHIRPGTDPSLVHAFRASTPSGDWRLIGHSAELINIHMVNSPGFPVYRIADGRHQATIAASAAPVRFLSTFPDSLPIPVERVTDTDLDTRISTLLALSSRAEHLASSIQPDIDDRAAHLHSLILDQ
jgi:hypothetical protein